MQDYFYIASDVSGLLLKFIVEQGIAAPKLVAELEQYGSNTRISYQQWCAYLDSLAEAAGRNDIGLDLGQMIEPAHCGVLGYLSLSCDYLGEALMSFERYQRLLYGGGGGKAEITADWLRFTWPELELDYDNHHSDELLIVGLCSFVQRMTDDTSLRPHRVGFAHTETEYMNKTAALLGDGVVYGQSQLFVEFPITYLSLPIQDSDPTLKKLLQQQAEALLKAVPGQGTFEDELKKALGKCLQMGSPTLSALARELNLSNRTLHRRLEERGLGFNAVLRNTRVELALQYLRDPALSLSDIAYLLAYSEQSAFTRAFRQWMGQSPLHYRKGL